MSCISRVYKRVRSDLLHVYLNTCLHLVNVGRGNRRSYMDMYRDWSSRGGDILGYDQFYILWKLNFMGLQASVLHSYWITKGQLGFRSKTTNQSSIAKPIFFEVITFCPFNSLFSAVEARVGDKCQNELQREKIKSFN